jgi:hypothetical protein
MMLRINPLNSDNPMSMRDAAIVSTIVAFVIWILNFLANATIGQVRADPMAFCFDAIKTYLVSWAGTFITLAGLEQYIKRQEKKPD